MSRIRVIAPDGRRGSIPAGPIPEGYTPITEASEHPVRAAVSSAVSGATLGTADYLLDDEAKEGAQRLRAENPVASTVGNVAGSIAATVALPELGMAGTAAKVGRIAVEGGLMGLGPQVSEAALTNRPLNKELLAADVLAGAATNVAFFGALKGAGTLASKAAGKAGEIFASDTFKESAKGIRTNLIKKRLQLDDDVFKVGDKLGVFDATDASAVAALADKAAKRSGTLAAEQLDNVSKAFPDANPLVDEWTKLASEAPSPDSIKRMRAIEKEFSDLAKATKDKAHSVTRAEHEAEQAARALDHKAEQKVARELHELEQVNKASKYYDAQEAKAAGKKGFESTKAGKGQAQKAPVAEEELVIEPFAEKPFTPEAYRDPAVPQGAESFLSLAEDFHASRNIYEKAAAPPESFDLLGTTIDLGPWAFFKPSVALAAVGGKFIKHQAKQNGGVLLSKPLAALAEGKIMPGIAKGFQVKVEQMLATAPGVLGPFGTVLSQAAAQGTDALLAAHSKLATGPQGGEYLATMGMRFESPEEARAYGQKLAMLEALEQQKDKFERAVDRDFDHLFAGRTPEREKTPKIKDLEGFVKTLQNTLRDPSSIYNATPSDVRTGAPGLTVEAGGHATQVAKFLFDRAPKPTDAWKPKSLQAPFNPAPGDVERFQRYVDAVSNPTALIANLASGRPSPEGVEVLKTFYPTMFQTMQSRAMARIVAAKKPLPYAQRLLLAQTFGQQILGQNPQEGLFLQSVHMAMKMEGQEAQQGASPNGRQIVNSNKNMQTQTQRIESRGQNAKTQP